MVAKIPFMKPFFDAKGIESKKYQRVVKGY